MSRQLLKPLPPPKPDIATCEVCEWGDDDPCAKPAINWLWASNKKVENGRWVMGCAEHSTGNRRKNTLRPMV